MIDKQLENDKIENDVKFYIEYIYRLLHVV
jgi:hypothetical protein